MGRSMVAEDREHARAVGCLLALLLSGCVGDEALGSGEALRGGRGGHHGGGHHGPDAGPAADAGASGDACTRTPDEWLATCDGDEPRTCGRGHSRHDPRTRGRGHVCDRGPSERECEDLASMDERTRELAALRVNVRVLGDRARRWCRGRDSEDDFEDLHFSHGYRRTLSVADLLDDPSVDLSAIADANRAFEGCVDRGVLVPWMETPVCTGSPVGPRPPRGSELRTTAGPAYAPCLALDGPCARGVVDPRSSCCTAQMAPRGTSCGDEPGLVCDGMGACVDGATVPEAERVRPSFDWLAIFPDGIPLDERGTGQLTPSVVANVLVVGSPPIGMPAGSVELHVPTVPTEVTVSGEPTQDPGPEPTGPPEILEPERPDVLAVLAPWVVGVERVTIARSPRDAPIRSISYAGPVAPHSLLLAPRADREIGFVWVVRGELDRLGTVLSDGSTAGAELVACSPPAGELELAAAAAPTAPRCDLVEGLAVVTGVDVAVAWLPNDTITPIDLLGQGPPPEVVPPGTPGIAGGAFGDFVPRGGSVPGSCGTFSCTLPGGCSGVRFCSGGLLGPCVPNVVAPDGCDGLDNNCNGLVDEGASASCNDGLDCTFDACQFGGAPSAGCVNIPAPRALCIGAVRPGPPPCVTAVCTAPSGTRSTRVRSTFDTPTGPGAWGAGPAPTGCSYFAGNNWCTNSYDSCHCNGPELCVPSSPANAGCVSNPTVAGPPVGGGAPIVYEPCDGDGLACTRDGICCEPSTDRYCRVDELLRATESGRALLEGRQTACGFGTRLEVVDGVPGYPSVSVSPVRCSGTGVPAPFSDRCPGDGNVCTTETCAEPLGTCGVVLPSISFTTGETFVSGERALVGESCSGRDASGCNVLTCNGAGGCAARSANPTLPPGAAHGPYPAFGGTCGAADSPITCFDEVCTNTTADASGIVSAECSPGGLPDSSECRFPQSCGGGTGICSSSAVLPPAEGSSDVPFGCRPPPGFCYLPGVPGDGVANGTCVPAGTADPINPCLVCNPAGVDPWGLTSPAPLGTPCGIGNACIAAAACDGAGHCAAAAFVPAGTLCDDERDCSTLDACDGAGVCRALACDPTVEVCDAIGCERR